MSDKNLNRAFDFKAITPSDTVFIVPDINETGGVPIVGIYVGTSAPSDITCLNASGAAITFKNVIQGSILPVQTTRVNSTGTTASNLVAIL